MSNVKNILLCADEKLEYAIKVQFNLQYDV